MSTPSLIVQCATPDEFEACHKVWDHAVEKKEGRRRYLDCGEMKILYGSVGKVWAAASAEFAVQVFKPLFLVDFGACGGLAPHLEVGDLVVATEIIEHDVVAANPRYAKPRASCVVTSEKDFEARLRNLTAQLGCPLGLGTLYFGALAAGDAVIHEQHHRLELHQNTGALAATWESSAIGRVANFHHIPFLSVRVVTDVGSARDTTTVWDQNFMEEYRKGVAQVLLPAARFLRQIIEQIVLRSC